MGRLRTGEVKKVLWFVMVANFIVAAAKIVVGTLINSTSVTADGLHSLSDTSSNIIGLIGIRLASKPVDKGHPYGHKKYETLTALFIVGMLIYLGLKIIFEAFFKLANPALAKITIGSLLVMGVSLCINLFVAYYEKKKGKAFNSMILVTDAIHTKSDVYITVGVIVSLIAIKLGAPLIVDSIVSLIVAGFILHAAYGIFKGSCAVLVDSAVVDTDRIEKITLRLEGVKGVHKIRNRGMVGDLHIDMHVLADSNLDLVASHELVHKIENAFKDEIEDVEVNVHLEPY